MRYVYKEVKFQKGLIDSKLAEHREIIDEMAKEGYRYTGWIPTKVFGYGNIGEVDLIFEKDE